MNRRGLSLVLVAALAFGACGSDKDDSASSTKDDTGTTVSAPVTGSKHRSAMLSGATEVPGPGDPDGSGEARISEQATGVAETFCYDLKVEGIAAPTLAHIHKGAKGVAGPVVVTLEAPVGDGEGGFESSTCVKVEDALAADIFANPSEYYVNVHNAEFPNGALRGQLGGASRSSGSSSG